MNEQAVFQWIVQGGSFAVLVWIIYKAFPEFQKNLGKIADDFRSDLKEIREESKEDREKNREALHGISGAVQGLSSRVQLHNEQYHKEGK